MNSFINKPSRFFWANLAVLVFPFFVYFHSLKAPFIFDDWTNIVQNPDIKSWDHLPQKLLYRTDRILPNRNLPQRPVVFLSFTFNYALGEQNPLGYHLFNVFLHSVTTLLIFILTRKVFFYSMGDSGLFYPLSVALIFALHPLQTEVVTYISNRSDGLAAFFYLLSLLLFVKAFEKNRAFYLGSYLAFFLALFSKEIAVTLPAIIFLYDYFFLSDSNFKKIKIRWEVHLFYWLVLILYILFRQIYFGKIGFMGGGIEKSWTAYSYFLTQMVVVIQYLKLFLFPQGQCVDHFIPPIKSFFDLKIIYSLVFYLLIGALTLAYFRKNKIFLFSFFWFGITLLPTSSFFPIYDALVERRLYLPSWGLCLGMISLILSLSKRIEKEKFQTTGNVQCRVKSTLSKIWSSLIVLYIILLSGFTWKRNQMYLDPIKIWEEAVRLYPNNNRALNNLGQHYAANKEMEKAKVAFHKALRLNPNVSGVYYNLGKLASLENNLEAESFFLKAIELEQENSDALKALGFFYFKNRNFSKALIFYEKALKLQPTSIESPWARPSMRLKTDLFSRQDYSLYNNLGCIYGELNKFREAEKSFQRAIEFEPLNARAYLNLAYLYTKEKKLNQAIAAYQTVLHLNPETQVLEKLNILRERLGNQK